ncbi:sensor histidine kinase [Schlesneria paludicola]|uniref:sensor histidine kinase n=1 Tax=Schlesneria paludicola TaxID=360056 RepID=UPI00029B0B9B|nr:HAMP domain-containing sensor histidine kinase [Schlesneria paludicola]
MKETSPIARSRFASGFDSAALSWRRFVDFSRSLRFRLTVWNTLVVLLTVIIALIVVREGLRHYLLIEIDTVLDDEVQEILLTVEKLYPDRDQVEAFLRRKDQAHLVHGWHIRWLDEDGVTTLWKSELAPDQPLSKLAKKTNGRNVLVSETHRSVEREIDSPGIPNYRIRVGTLVAFVDEDVGRLTRVLAPVGLAILLLAPVGGLLLAERAVEPLQRLIQTTERLRPSHLEERLELRGVGDELDQLASKINEFLDEIADHLQKNRDFVANAAHDLRSPLAAIQSLVEVTVEKPRSVEEYEDLLFQINDEVHYLGQLVNQLLQLAETESTASDMPMEPVRLSEVVARTVEMFEPVAEERGVDLKFDLLEDLVVTGVPRQLRQVLTNLVDNAVKFSVKGGVVTVTLGRDNKPGFGLLTVCDTGLGIPAESVSRVFDRFYQVEKARQRFGEKRGNGLGLSICQSIVHAHSGSISVVSELGKGSTFSMSLPLSSGT